MFEAKLTEGVVTPCVHVSFCCKHSSKHVTTGHLNHWYIEVDHIWNRRDLFKHFHILLSELILLNFSSIFDCNGHATHHNKGILSLIVNTVEDSIDVAGSHIVDDTFELLVAQRSSQRVLLVQCLVLLDLFVSKSKL